MLCAACKVQGAYGQQTFVRPTVLGRMSDPPTPRDTDNPTMPPAGPPVNRRALLAGIAGTTVAGCSSDQEDTVNGDSTVGDQSDAQDNVADGDCVDPEAYEELRKKYERLREEYQALQERTEYAVNPPYVVADGRKFNISYITLEDEVQLYQIGSQAFESQITIGNYMRDFSIEQLDFLGWDGVINRFDNNTKLIEVGDFGRYDKYSPYVIPDNFVAIAEDIHSMYSDDRRRLRGAWNFVTQINTYTKEIRETPRLPLETLLSAGGDCEDSCILLASIIEAMPTNWTTKFVYMDLYNPSNPQNINHLALRVGIGGSAGVVETTSAQKMFPFEDLRGFSVEVDPPAN